MTTEEILTELQKREIKIEARGDKLHIEAPAGTMTPELKELLRQHKKELIGFKKEAKDPQKEFHQLLISTFTEIDQYRFTDFPLAWAKKNGHTDISFNMFKAETNLNGAVLEGHLEESKYWAGKLVAGYKQLYEAYRLEIKQLIVSLKVADFELSLTESGLKINYPDPLPEQAQKLYEQLKENTHGVINCLKEAEQ